LMNGKVSLTPHIGAATGEAQDRIGLNWRPILMRSQRVSRLYL